MTTQQDSERLARIEGKLDVIALQVTHVKDESVDHETRLRAVERLRYSLPAGLGVLGALAVELIGKLGIGA